MNLVIQPTDNTCTSACLSMITDKPIDEVIKEFHNDWQASLSNPSEYLKYCNIQHEVNTNPFNFILEWGNIYLLTVPSLNIKGGLHHIVVDLTDIYNNVGKVYDPNNGKDGKSYYVSWVQPQSELQYPLKSFNIDICIRGTK